MAFRLIGELVILIVFGIGIWHLGMWLSAKADENARIKGDEEEEKTTIVMKGEKKK